MSFNDYQNGWNQGIAEGRMSYYRNPFDRVSESDAYQGYEDGWEEGNLERYDVDGEWEV